jgi:hypothetical protein
MLIECSAVNKTAIYEKTDNNLVISCKRAITDNKLCGQEKVGSRPEYDHQPADG